MTVPAPPVPAEKRPRKSAAGIALRVAGALPALLAGLMVFGIIGSMAQGNLDAGGAVVDVILLVGLPGALAAGLFWWAGRLDQRTADRAASAPAAPAPRPVARIAPVQAPPVQAPSVQEPEPSTAASTPAPEPAAPSRPSPLSSIEVPMFGRKKKIVELEARLAQETRERARLQEFVDSHGGPQIWDQEKILEDLRRRAEEQEAELAAASARIEQRKQEEAAEVRRVAEQTRAEERRRTEELRADIDRLQQEKAGLGADIERRKQEQTERELERERKAELREQARAERELEAERERLEKEKQHYLNVLKVVQDTGDQEETARLKEELVAIEKGINDVEERTANIRAGYVYVISNIGAFGDRMVKIGMTRRLDPMDRVRELGDASVPFGFDVHALFFSDDAVTLEADLHRRFADKRVNRINTRREFFYATPAQVRDALSQIAGNLLEFTDEPEAEQYRLSLQIAAEEKAEGTAAPVADRTEQDPDENPQS